LWREYFGCEAIIFGVDVNPKCKEIKDCDISIRIGSQADPEFLKAVVGEMGGLDIVIDDGSHIASHQRKSFETLFPLLHQDGVYIVEDLHTSYFRGVFEGGIGRRGTFIEEAKKLVDAIHGWYHNGKSTIANARTTVDSLHFYDSIVVIEKRVKQRPFHTKLGVPSFSRK